MILQFAAPFRIEDDILNLFDKGTMHTFYLSQISQMFLVRRNKLPASGVFGKFLHRYLTPRYKLHIITTDGSKTVVPVSQEDRQVFITLISRFRNLRLA
ncbi:hypothetical protein [Flavobacterium magnum]|nr:hypothetical protein [Flavobacterium magnum]